MRGAGSRMVSTTPAVSIAIRAFRKHSLATAIDSVLQQSWRDLELIVYDDVGDLQEVAERFIDSRLRYVRAERKLGAAGRFAAAVSFCRGTYIGLLDDDDRYEPRFVERLAAVLAENPRAGTAFCRDVYESNGLRFQVRSYDSPGAQPDVARRVLTERWGVAPSAMLLRRTALEAAERVQPMPDGVSPDLFVEFHIAMAGWEQWFVDEELSIRGWLDDRISGSLVCAEYAVATFRSLRTDDRELDRLRRRELARRLIVRAGHRLIAGRRREALADVRAARETDAAAHQWLRLMAGLAGRMPLLGSAAARLALAFRRFFRAIRQLPAH